VPLFVCFSHKKPPYYGILSALSSKNQYPSNGRFSRSRV
jgi:hypothetical protein